MGFPAVWFCPLSALIHRAKCELIVIFAALCGLGHGKRWSSLAWSVRCTLVDGSATAARTCSVQSVLGTCTQEVHARLTRATFSRVIWACCKNISNSRKIWLKKRCVHDNAAALEVVSQWALGCGLLSVERVFALWVFGDCSLCVCVCAFVRVCAFETWVQERERKRAAFLAARQAAQAQAIALKLQALWRGRDGRLRGRAKIRAKRIAKRKAYYAKKAQVCARCHLPREALLKRCTCEQRLGRRNS